jgi:hypothetical protein
MKAKNAELNKKKGKQKWLGVGQDNVDMSHYSQF